MSTIMLLAIVVSCTSIISEAAAEDCCCPCECQIINSVSSGRNQSEKYQKTVQDQYPFFLLKRLAYTHRIKEQERGDQDKFVETGNELRYGM
ncbi:unnamed protein product [Pieris brassicae]|uniref:Secreted protein n=1 Tax=Pieris brassicae TaxID=7116 RepID=A0A9P0TFB4_PIEBR|nr:unnamed protein product [Pieris brassicae]